MIASHCQRLPRTAPDEVALKLGKNHNHVRGYDAEQGPNAASGQDSFGFGAANTRNCAPMGTRHKAMEGRSWLG